MNSAAQKLLDRLARHRRTAPDRWAAACPCCQSRKGTPLAIRALDDGRVLIHGFCGCETESILGALGLTINDLFPERLPHHEVQPAGNRLPARDALLCIEHEAYVAVILTNEIVQRGSATGEELQRLSKAAQRIGKAAAHAR